MEKKTANLAASQNPKYILDLATGSGDLALEIKRKCSDAKITCSDFCAPMLEIANQKGLKPCSRRIVITF